MQSCTDFSSSISGWALFQLEIDVDSDFWLYDFSLLLSLTSLIRERSSSVVGVDLFLHINHQCNHVQTSPFQFLDELVSMLKLHHEETSDQQKRGCLYYAHHWLVEATLQPSAGDSFPYRNRQWNHEVFFIALPAYFSRYSKTSPAGSIFRWSAQTQVCRNRQFRDSGWMGCKETATQTRFFFATLADTCASYNML